MMLRNRLSATRISPRPFPFPIVGHRQNNGEQKNNQKQTSIAQGWDRFRIQVVFAYPGPPITRSVYPLMVAPENVRMDRVHFSTAVITPTVREIGAETVLDQGPVRESPERIGMTTQGPPH